MESGNGYHGNVYIVRWYISIYPKQKEVKTMKEEKEKGELIDWGLLKCALNKHKFGRVQHDDVLNRWVRICRNCSKILEVDAPKDKNGRVHDSHEWLQLENEQSARELIVAVKEIKNIFSKEK